MTFRWLGALGAAVVVLCAGLSRAAAQDPGSDEEARVHFRVGRVYYDSGRFEEAATEFQRAYDLSHRPELLYNVFVANRDAGHLAVATNALRDYLRLVPDAPDREQLTARLAVMERMVAEQGAEAPAAAPTPEPAPTTTPEASATEATAVTPTERETSGGGMWDPGWIIAGVGVATMAGGIVTGLMALDAQSRLDAMCDVDHACDPGFEGTRDEAGLLAGLTDTLLIAGGVVAVTGVVLALVIPGGDSSEEAAPQVSFACDSTGCAGAVRTRF